MFKDLSPIYPVDSNNQRVCCLFGERELVVDFNEKCQPSPPLYCPDNLVTRGQMAVFPAKAFGL